MVVKKSKAKVVKRQAVKKAAPKKKVAKKAVKKTIKPKKTREVIAKKKVTKAKNQAAPKGKGAVKNVVVKKEAIPKVKDKPFTKTEMCQAIAGNVGITKKQVGEVLEAIAKITGAHLKKKHPFTLPGMLKITKIHKPAKKARKGINPFTGEEMMFKARAAHYVVKIRTLKKLKEMV